MQRPLQTRGHRDSYFFLWLPITLVYEVIILLVILSGVPVFGTEACPEQGRRVEESPPFDGNSRSQGGDFSICFTRYAPLAQSK